MRTRLRHASATFLREARATDVVHSTWTQRGVYSLGVVVAATCLFLATRRYETFHDTTFDLAFYARMVWGETHGSGWDPIVNASVYGLHLVWIFEVLGWIARAFGAVPTLLLTQALAVGLTAVPLARLGARHLGKSGTLIAPLAFFLHPNLVAVASGEFHPGTVAVLPIAWAAEALDRRNAPLACLASLGIVACREDLGLVAGLVSLGIAFAAHRQHDSRTRALAGASALSCFAYVGVFLLVIHPAYAPAHGSLGLHFGHYGTSPAEVLVGLVTDPVALVSHLAREGRWLYVPVILAPFALLPLLSPSTFVYSAPVLGIALLSAFPTTTCLDSHYLTPALPLLVHGALRGAARLHDPRARAVTLGAAACAAHLVAGASPLSMRFDRSAFVDDARSSAMRDIVEAIPPLASVQAPDAMLAHLAERRTLRRAPPPEMETEFVVLDLAHRRRFRHREDLVRTDEEPVARAWLSRSDHAVVAARGDFVLLERGLSPRESVAVERTVTGTAPATEGRALTACLALIDARLEGRVLVLTLGARSACPDDLALRIGTGRRPRRVDLIGDGWLSPAHFQAGDRLRSRHTLSAIELSAIETDGLRVGAIRASGARPAHEDPLSLEVRITR